MQYIINGGIYRVVFNGIYGSEFSGEHPSLVIRTLKEKEIYMVIPLTTYTKEKWEKIRKLGYGIRIKSTNSIARIDKYQVIHKRDIKNRWKDGNKHLRIYPDELINTNKKVDKYIELSSIKANKEYEKHYEQYNKLLNYFDEIYNNKKSEENIFNIELNSHCKRITCKKSNIHWLSLADIYEIVKRYFNSSDIKIYFEEKNLIIKIKNS